MNQINITEAGLDWELDSLASTLTRGGRNNLDVKLALEEAISKCTNHEVALKSIGRMTKFIRLTQNSDTIAHNERVRISLEKEISSNLFIKFSP